MLASGVLFSRGQSKQKRPTTSIPAVLFCSIEGLDLVIFSGQKFKAGSDGHITGVFHEAEAVSPPDEQAVMQMKDCGSGNCYMAKERNIHLASARPQKISPALEYL